MIEYRIQKNRKQHRLSFLHSVFCILYAFLCDLCDLCGCCSGVSGSHHFQVGELLEVQRVEKAQQLGRYAQGERSVGVQALDGGL